MPVLIVLKVVVVLVVVTVEEEHDETDEVVVDPLAPRPPSFPPSFLSSLLVQTERKKGPMSEHGSNRSQLVLAQKS